MSLRYKRPERITRFGWASGIKSSATRGRPTTNGTLKYKIAFQIDEVNPN